MKNQKKISAIIPSYNREETIRRCINSVLRQTYPVSEIIVVDDGSEDNTLQILETEYGDSVVIIKQSHKGAQAARNAGIIAAQGEYIAFLDSDDEWMENKIELQMKALEEKPNAVICGNCYVAKKGNKAVFKMKGYSGCVYRMTLVSSFALFSAVITRKDNLIKIGFLDEKVPAFQEWDMAMMLSETCEFIFLDQPLFIYYQHNGDTISKDRNRDIAGQEYIYHKYKYSILAQHGVKGLTHRYKSICVRCIRFRDIRAFKYLFLYIFSRMGILFLNTNDRR